MLKTCLNKLLTAIAKIQEETDFSDRLLFQAQLLR